MEQGVENLKKSMTSFMNDAKTVAIFFFFNFA